MLNIGSYDLKTNAKLILNFSSKNSEAELHISDPLQSMIWLEFLSRKTTLFALSLWLLAATHWLTVI